MLPIEAAILRTILYADVFNFPLTLDELHRYLISHIPHSKAAITKTLKTSVALKQILEQHDAYFCLEDRSNIVAIRIEREQISCQLWEDAVRYGQWLSHIPFVEMVALTGALAVRNPASAEDDFDYLIVTRPKRVWIARLMAVVMVRVVRLLGRELCPNYVLASDQLLQTRQDLYLAHEVAQMRPIYGGKLYHAMNAQNDWVEDYLANAQPFAIQPDGPRRIRRMLELFLDGRLGDALEEWEYQRKLKKFEAQLQPQTTGAELDGSKVKGHFEDHGMPVMKRYAELLAQYGLTEDFSDRLAGD